MESTKERVVYCVRTLKSHIWRVGIRALRFTGCLISRIGEIPSRQHYPDGICTPIYRTVRFTAASAHLVAMIIDIYNNDRSPNRART